MGLLLDRMHEEGDDIAFVSGLQHMREMHHRTVITGLATTIEEWPELVCIPFLFVLQYL